MSISATLNERTFEVIPDPGRRFRIFKCGIALIDESGPLTDSSKVKRID